MTSERKIIVVDPTAELPPIEFSPKEFNAAQADARERGLTVTENIKADAYEFVARRKGIIVDFPSHNKTPAASDVLP